MTERDEVTRADVGGSVITVVHGDLTTEDVDAIVNAANIDLQHGGGVAGAIVRAGGASIQDESDAWVRTHGPLEPGIAAVTGAGMLRARRVVHVAGPVYDPTAGDENARLLAQATTAALDAAHVAGARTVALPAISAGIYGYPRDAAARVIATAVRGWFVAHPAALDEVRLVAFDADSADDFARAVDEPNPASSPTMLTVGHGAIPITAFLEILRQADVTALVDVRAAPASRRHPQFGTDALRTALDGVGITYTWEPRLGGRRRPRTRSLNTSVRDPTFRGYADHMATDEFRVAIADLLDLAARRTTTVMCAEGVWTHCHRKLIADHLVLVADVGVQHLFHDGRREPHIPTPVARRVDETLVYDLGSTPPLLRELA